MVTVSYYEGVCICQVIIGEVKVTNYCVPRYNILVVSLLVMKIWFKMGWVNTVNIFNPGFADKVPSQVSIKLNSFFFF